MFLGWGFVRWGSAVGEGFAVTTGYRRALAVLFVWGLFQALEQVCELASQLGVVGLEFFVGGLDGGEGFGLLGAVLG